MIIIVNAGCLLTIDLIYAMQYRRNMEIRFSIQLYLVSVITTEFPRCLRNKLLRWASFFFASVVGVWTRGKCAATAPPPPGSVPVCGWAQLSPSIRPGFVADAHGPSARPASGMSTSRSCFSSFPSQLNPGPLRKRSLALSSLSSPFSFPFNCAA